MSNTVNHNAQDIPVKRKNSNSCPVCGHNQFVTGIISGASFIQQGHLLGQRIKVRKCERCGNIQLFAD